MLDALLARKRQDRLLAHAASVGLDAIVITQPHHVYYLTAHLPAWRHLAGLILRPGGKSLLVTANSIAKDVAADEVISYRANPGGTLRQDQAQEIAKLLLDHLGGVSHIGFDTSETASLLHGSGRTMVCIDETLWQMRRPKDADELKLMTKAIDATRAMYDRARQIIHPGVPEIDVFNALHAAAVESTGAPMTALLGNDFACGVGGGPARAGRKAEAGELYILDLGPTYRGYFADNARVISVDRKPTDAQLKAYEAIVGVFPIVESLAKPGVRCREIYDAVDAHFHATLGKKQVHHLGHGVGLQAHEFPHLNPNWDDSLVEGEIFTCEPGVYAPDLHGGIRIENQYWVTKTGVTNLTPFPLAMI